jgi:hypothetical protein
MSLLSQDVHAELTQLLQALQASDNSIRSQAEDHLQNSWTNSRPEVLLIGLVEQIQGGTDNVVSLNPQFLTTSQLLGCEFLFFF